MMELNKTIKLTKDYDVVRCGSGIAILFYEEPAESNTSYMLSKFEKQIIEHIPENLRYMARDENGDLYIYEEKPCRQQHRNGVWSNYKEDGRCECIPLKNVFEFIKWKNDEPWEFRCEVNN